MKKISPLILSRAWLAPVSAIFISQCIGCAKFGTAEFAASTQSVSEAAGTATATVSLSSSQVLSMRIPYTIGGTATCSAATNTIDDYGCALPSGSTQGTLVIPAGSQSASLSFSLFQHVVPKPDRTVVITLGTPENGVLGTTTTQTITIQGPGSGGGGGGGGGGLTAAITPPGAPSCPTTPVSLILSLDGPATSNLVFGLAVTPSGPIADSTDYSVASPGPASLGTPSVNSVTILSGQSLVNLSVALNCPSPGSSLQLTLTPPAGVTMPQNFTFVGF